jgi:3-oxoacyl-[acyl-carrier protein] reductase
VSWEKSARKGVIVPDLKNRTALVTGGSRGIGRAIATRLATDGATVAVHYGNNDEAAQDTVAEIESAGGTAFPLRADLTSPGTTVAELFDQLDEGLRRRTGDTRLDILVNNAGISLRAPIEELTVEEFDRVHTVNVRAPLLVTQAALARLGEGSRIVNISSASATRIAFPPALAYAMAKGALDAMTRTLAQHLGARGVTVNSVAPGFIETDLNRAWLREEANRRRIAGMSALSRVGEPDDVAGAVVFLVSDDGRWVTGQVLDATGGMLLGM